MQSVHVLQCDLGTPAWPEWNRERYDELVETALMPLRQPVPVDLLVLPPHFGTLATLALLEPTPVTFPELLARAAEVQIEAEKLWVEDVDRLGAGAAVVCAGSWYCAEGESVSHEARILEGGRLLGVQRQTHRFGEETQWPLERSLDLEPIESSIGRIGVLLGSDPIYPEVGRILALEGADLFVSLATYDVPYPEPEQWARIWSQVQSNQVVGLESSLCGALLERRLAGRSAAITLCDLTPDGSGYLGRIAGTGSLSAAYEPAEVNRVRSEYPVLGLANRDLYRNEASALTGWGRPD